MHWGKSKRVVSVWILLEWEAEKKRAYLGEDGVIAEGGTAR
jgi:hypothetical protein